MLGSRLLIQRVGVDGDYRKACALIADLDGKVAAIGLGGTDLYLVSGKRKYVLEESRRLAESAKATPVVDGSGLKDTLERETIRWLGETGAVDIRGKRVLLVSAVDRFGLAEALAEAGCETVFGDLIFSLGLPIPVRSLSTIRVIAALSLPFLRHLPVRMLYPTGNAQGKSTPRHAKFYHWADIVAGDFHFIRKYLPARMDRKIIITNTVTPDDLDTLRERGCARLVTTTPEMAGRSFGTNVMEAVIVALAGKSPCRMDADQYLDWLRRLGWRPRITDLAMAGADTAGREARTMPGPPEG